MAGRPSSLATELARSWRELGGLLASRRLLGSLSDGSDSRLTPTKLRALEVLAERAPMRIHELAAGVSIDDTTATRLVDRLEAMGVAERRRDPADGRATEVVLTAEGRRLVDEVSARRREFFREVLSSLDADERVELVRLTAKAADAVRAHSDQLVGR